MRYRYQLFIAIALGLILSTVYYLHQSAASRADTPSSSASGPACSQVQGDTDHDGNVNLTDFEVWRRIFTAQ